jgi:hypothetical protein
MIIHTLAKIAMDLGLEFIYLFVFASAKQCLWLGYLTLSRSFWHEADTLLPISRWEALLIAS